MGLQDPTVNGVTYPLFKEVTRDADGTETVTLAWKRVDSLPTQPGGLLKDRVWDKGLSAGAGYTNDVGGIQDAYAMAVGIDAHIPAFFRLHPRRVSLTPTHAPLDKPTDFWESFAGGSAADSITESSLTFGSSTTAATAVTQRALTFGSGGGAAVAQTRLVELNSTIAGTSFATGSFTPTGNRLLLATVESWVSGGAAAPTGLSGNSVTWVQVATATQFQRRITVFRGMVASPSAGALTASFAAAQDHCKISVSEFSNVLTTGSDGANAVVQSVTNTAAFGTSFSVTLAAFTSISNATFGAFVQASAGTITPGSGFTEISELASGVSIPTIVETEWRSTPSVTVGATCTASGGWAGIAIEIAVGAGTSAASFVTETITPTGNNLVLLAIHSAVASSAAPSSVTGNGITWTSVDTQTFVAGARRLSLYRGLVTSPTAGAVTITFAAAQDSCSWSISEFANVDTGGTNGSAAVVQSATATSAGATSLSVTLAGFGSASNATYGAFATNATSGITSGSGFTEIHDVTVAGGLETEWRSDNDTGVDASDSVAATVQWRGFAVEIKATTPIAAFQTASITPSADKLILASVSNEVATAMGFAQGTYTGDGSESQAITGLGFAPKMVIVVKTAGVGTEIPLVRITGDTTAHYVAAMNSSTAGILSLDADGFTVREAGTPTGAYANVNTMTYHYLAFGGDKFVVGTYTGDGAATKTITGVGGTPEMAGVIWSQNTPVWYVTTESVAAGVTLNLGPQSIETDVITALTSDGFTLGNNTHDAGAGEPGVNRSGVSYIYFAILNSTNFAHGSYTGNSTDNRNLPAVAMSFDPNLVVIKTTALAGARVPVGKNTALAGDTSYEFDVNGTAANLIQSLTPASGKFQVGTDTQVNLSSDTYYFFAFGTSAGTTPGTPTLAGNGLTWVSVATSVKNNYRLTVFRTMGTAPSAGVVTIDYGGVAQTAVRWSIAEFGGVLTTGSDGANAVVQSATNTGNAVTSLTVTLSAFGASTNGLYGAFGNSNAAAITPGSGITEIHEVQASSAVLQTEWKSSSDTTVDASGTTGTWVGVALEIQSATLTVGVSGNGYIVVTNDQYATIMSVTANVISETDTEEFGANASAGFGTYFNGERYVPLGKLTTSQKLTSVSSAGVGTWEDLGYTAVAFGTQQDGPTSKVSKGFADPPTGVANQLALSSDGDTYADGFDIGDATYNITKIADTGVSSYVAKEDNLYEADPTSLSVKITSNEGSHASNGVGMVAEQGTRAVWYNHGSNDYFFDGASTPKDQGADSNPFNKAIPNVTHEPRQGRYLESWRVGRWKYSLLQVTETTVKTYIEARVRFGDRYIYHYIDRLDGIARGMFVDSQFRLWVGWVAQGTYIYYQLGKDGSPDAGRDAIGYGAASSTYYMYYPEIDYALETTLKQLWQVTVLTRNVDSTCPIQVIYHADGGTETNYSTAITTSGVSHRYVSATTATRIRFGVKIVTTAGYDPTTADPQVWVFATRVFPRPNLEGVYDIVFDSLEPYESTKPATDAPRAMRNELVALEGGAPVSCIDPEGTAVTMRFTKVSDVQMRGPAPDGAVHYVIVCQAESVSSF